MSVILPVTLIALGLVNTNKFLLNNKAWTANLIVTVTGFKKYRRTLPTTYQSKTMTGKIKTTKI